MSTDPFPSSDAEFDQFLRRATRPVPLADSFQREVWDRISEQEPDAAGAFRLWCDELLNALSRPLAAVLTIALTASAGLLLGQVRPATSGDSGKLAYAQSVSPFLQNHSGVEK